MSIPSGSRFDAQTARNWTSRLADCGLRRACVIPGFWIAPSDWMGHLSSVSIIDGAKKRNRVWIFHHIPECGLWIVDIMSFRSLKANCWMTYSIPCNFVHLGRQKDFIWKVRVPHNSFTPWLVVEINTLQIWDDPNWNWYFSEGSTTHQA